MRIDSIISEHQFSDRFLFLSTLAFHTVLESYCPRVLLSSSLTVLQSYCPPVLLSSSLTVLQSYCPPVLLSSSLTVLQSYCPPVLLSSSLTVLQSYCPSVSSVLESYTVLQSFNQSHCPPVLSLHVPRPYTLYYNYTE